MRKENGVWHIRENWFWKYIWGFNSRCFFKVLIEIPFVILIGDRFSVKKSKFPKNLYSLFLGFLFGIILTPFCIMFGIVGCLFLLVLCAIPIVIAAFLGFYFNFYSKTLWPYKHWGERRIPIAPWEVCAALLALYLIAISSIYTIVTVIVVLCVIIAVIVAVSLLSDAFKAIWERVKMARRWLCPLVVIEPKRQK